MNFKLWLEQNLLRVPLQNLLMSRRAMWDTMQDLQTDKGSRTPGPVLVFPVENEYQLVDGYHRVFETMLQGADSILARIEPTMATNYAVADETDKLQFDPRLRYKGLENLADESVLKDIRRILGK